MQFLCVQLIYNCRVGLVLTKGHVFKTTLLLHERFYDSSLVPQLLVQQSVNSHKLDFHEMSKFPFSLSILEKKNLKIYAVEVVKGIYSSIQVQCYLCIV